MGSVRNAGLVLVAILVAASLYGYNEYASLYNENVDRIRSRCSYPFHKAVWGEYEENMDKLDLLFRVDWRYMSYDAFFKFTTSLSTDRPVNLYYDPDAMMMWIQDTFPGSRFRVSVYRHKDFGNFMDWINSLVEII